MDFKKLNINESSKQMKLWTDNSEEYIRHELDPDYSGLRKQLLADFNNIVTAHQYTTDFSFGIFLYARLKEAGFTVRDAADDDKWRYLCDTFDLTHYDDIGLYNKLNKLIQSLNKSTYKDKNNRQWININIE